MQEDIDAVNTWLTWSKLKLNVDKTHMMILGTKQRLNTYEKSGSVISIFSLTVL